MANALLRLGNAESDLGDVIAAFEHFDRAGEILARLGPRPSSASRDLVAMKHQSRAIALRRAGRPDEAIEAYGEALKALGDPQDSESRASLALLLDNLGNALDDAERLDDALEAVDESIRLWELLIEEGLPRWSNLANAYQNRANRNLKCGYYDEAAEQARAALEVFDDLISRGRSDLREAAARLRAAFAFALHGSLDLEAAVVALDEAIASFAELAEGGFPDGLLDVLKTQADELREVLSSTRGHLPRVLDAAQERLDAAESVARQGEALMAVGLLELALLPLAWISSAHNIADAHELLGCRRRQQS